jgi:hypothetical protein
LVDVLSHVEQEEIGTGVLAALYIGYPLLAFRLGRVLLESRPGDRA